MLKIFIFTIFLIASPAFGLVKTLFQTENHCYSGCHSNYRASLKNLDACKNGCDFKLQKENCADQCKLFSIDEQIQASCIVGCSMNQPAVEEFDEHSPRKAIILIRLRQPVLRLPFAKNDPVETYNDMIKQLKDESKSVDLKPIAKITKDIPLIKSFDEVKTNQFKQILIQEEDQNDYLQQLTAFICKQAKFPGWILISILVLCSLIVLYMIVSLCRSKLKHHDLSIQAEELILEKEILQLDTPVKITLTREEQFK